MNDQTDNTAKAKSWITLGGGALIALIPFVGLIMWLLFLPIVILVGRWGYRIIGTGDTKGGLIHIGAALLFVPFAFAAPMISTGLVADLIWPPVAQGTVDQSVSGKSSDSDSTIEYWKKLRGFETAASSELKEDTRQYPMVESGQFDFTKFNKDDFEKLTQHFFEDGTIKRRVATDIANLPVLGVDSDLVRFKIDLCEHWNSAAQVSLGFAELVNSLHQQKLQFTNGEAYALRTAKALMGQGDMEAAYQESQHEIDRRLQAWNLVRTKDETLREQVAKKEQEVKALLTRKYNWEFQ